VLRIAANLSTLFRELPLTDRFRAARAAGFDGVEIQFPYEEPAENLARAAADAATPVILINAPVMPPSYPLGMAGRPEMQATFRAQLPRIADYAEALGVRFVHALAGTVDAPGEREGSEAQYAENLLFAAEILAPRGIQVLIEALNPLDAPNYLVGSLDAALSILDRCNGHIGLQFDAYHIARMGLDPVAQLTRALPRVRHVQFADEPGRHEPGTGHIPFASLVSALNKSGYVGWLSAEYVPSGATAAGLGWLRQWRQW
jgi:hydroxypyruvate isomerase